jgi:hypothetical protein
VLGLLLVDTDWGLTTFSRTKKRARLGKWEGKITDKIQKVSQRRRQRRPYNSPSVVSPPGQSLRFLIFFPSR